MRFSADANPHGPSCDFEATRSGCSLICSPEHAILHDRLIHVVRGKGDTVTLTDPGPVIRVSKEAAMPGNMIVMHGQGGHEKPAPVPWAARRGRSAPVLGQLPAR